MRSKTCIRAPCPPSDLVQNLLPSPPKDRLLWADGSDGDEEGDDADEEYDDDEADLLTEQVEVTEGGPNMSAGALSSKFCLQ